MRLPVDTFSKVPVVKRPPARSLSTQTKSAAQRMCEYRQRKKFNFLSVTKEKPL